ncbi:hypothetical protein FORC065_2766 [Yersinia enterocolitica]|nr:hypothetical protein FORC065_2766 [Yersinia enterocolitica]
MFGIKIPTPFIVWFNPHILPFPPRSPTLLTQQFELSPI